MGKKNKNFFCGVLIVAAVRFTVVPGALHLQSPSGNGAMLMKIGMCVDHTHYTFFFNKSHINNLFAKSTGLKSSSGGYRWRLHSPGFRTDLVSLCGLMIVVPQVATPSNVWRARSYIHFEHAETITSEFNLLGRTNGPDIDTLSTSAVAKTVGQDTSRIASYDRSVLARGLFRGHQRRNFPQRKRVHRPGPLSLARSTGHSYSTDNGSWSLL